MSLCMAGNGRMVITTMHDKIEISDAVFAVKGVSYVR